MRAIRFFGLVVALGLVASVANGEDVKSGPDKKIGGAFNVKAVTGEKAGKTLCYVCKFGGEQRPASVLVFTQKADDNLVEVVKAIDGVQKTNDKLGTVVIGVSGDAAARSYRLRTNRG